MAELPTMQYLIAGLLFFIIIGGSCTIPGCSENSKPIVIKAGLGVAGIATAIAVYYIIKNKSLDSLPMLPNVPEDLNTKVKSLKAGMDFCYTALNSVCNPMQPELCQDEFVNCMNRETRRILIPRLQ